MASPHTFSVDDKDLDDAELWAVIDSAAASHSSTTTTRSRKPLTLKQSPSLSPPPLKSPHTSFNLIQSPKYSRNSGRNYYYSDTVDDDDGTRVSPDGEVLQNNQQRPRKVARRDNGGGGSGYGDENRMVVVNQRTTPKTSPQSYLSPDCGGFDGREIISPVSESSPSCYRREGYGSEEMVHSLSGRFPSVSMFKEYQNKAMAILEKTDCTMIAGSPYIKKSGWRKIAFYFNVSFEIKDKSIELDENRNVQRAEFTVRAHMQGGRFSDGWGSCERREKRFMKPNQDIPSTAETRAKNKACQGQFRQKGTIS
ncbi:hypothetical protein ACHQM5_021375 [Ranunculus cassubicifolius]